MYELKEISPAENLKRVIRTDGYWVHYENRINLEIQSGNCSFTLGYNHKELKSLLPTNEIDFLRGNSGESAEPVDRLSNTLTKEAGMDGIAYAVSGSDGNECAFYIIDLYWTNKGEPQRRYIISIPPCYHGTTVVCRSANNDIVEKRQSRFVPIRGRTWYTTEDSIANETNVLEQIIETFKTRNDIGAILIESYPWNKTIAPWSHNFYQLLRATATLYGANLIVDDIAGYGGKIGTLFTHTAYNIKPDIVTIGKALTNGLIPLSACLINDKILKQVKTTFNWGHTWQPNMYGVRVANRCIELIQERMAHSKVIEKNLNDIGDRLKSKGLVRNVIGNGVWKSFVPEPNPIPISLAEIDKAGMSATTNENTIKTIIPLIADDIYFEELEKRLEVCLTNIQEQRTQGILI